MFSKMENHSTSHPGGAREVPNPHDDNEADYHSRWRIQCQRTDQFPHSRVPYSAVYGSPIQGVPKVWTHRENSNFR
jgi:hypothetical protein